jgi:hypothetical protein
MSTKRRRPEPTLLLRADAAWLGEQGTEAVLPSALEMSTLPVCAQTKHPSLACVLAAEQCIAAERAWWRLAQVVSAADRASAKGAARAETIFPCPCVVKALRTVRAGAFLCVEQQSSSATGRAISNMHIISFAALRIIAQHQARREVCE